MEKEKLLKRLTDYIEEIANLTPEQKVDVKMRAMLIDSAKVLKADLELLNSCDQLWFEKEYGKWINEILYPKYKDRINEIKNVLKTA